MHRHIPHEMVPAPLPDSRAARPPSRPLWLLATTLLVSLAAACQETGDGDDSTQALCGPNTSTVILTNETGGRIRDLRIRDLAQGTESDNLINPDTGLPTGAEVAWSSCSTTTQALVITLTDGTRTQSDLPTLDPSYNRLRVGPGGTVVPPPPAPKPPTPGELLPDPTRQGVERPMTR